jgi:hypothetical protein
LLELRNPFSVFKDIAMRTSLIVAAVLAAVVGSASFASAAVIKIDFGRHDGTNGAATVNPDVNGNRWNSLSASSWGSANEFASGFTAPLIDTTGAATAVTLVTTSAWGANGYNSGGLQNPSAARLGDFAIETATRDYWYGEASAGRADTTFNLTGLDSTKTYNFRIFGSRGTTETRISRYTLTGQNTVTADLQTSGADIGGGTDVNTGGVANNGTGTYDGNDDEITTLNGVKPTAGGVISFTNHVQSSNFAYVNIMEVTSAPEPASLGLLGAVGAMLLTRRRRAC